MTSLKKIVEIEKCRQCPFAYEKSWRDEFFTCGKNHDIKIGLNDEIPPNCPLPDTITTSDILPPVNGVGFQR